MPLRAKTGDAQPPLYLNRRAVPPLPALRAFAAVGQLGGIRKAAVALSLDHAAVSRHLRTLEAWAGTPLLERGVTGGRLTPEAAKFHARVCASLHEIAEAAADLIDGPDESALQITCVPGLASNWLLARLSLFRVQYPDIAVEMRPTDQAPDFTTREVDADIRYVIDAAPDPRLIENVETLVVARPPVLAVGSPALVDTLTLKEPADVRGAPLLHEGNFRQWTAWFAENGVTLDRELSGHRLWQAHLAVDAARRGEGLALTNGFLVGDDFKSGRLVNVSAQVGAKPVVMGGYVFCARRDRWRRPALTTFRRWLAREASAQILQ